MAADIIPAIDDVRFGLALIGEQIRTDDDGRSFAKARDGGDLRGMNSEFVRSVSVIKHDRPLSLLNMKVQN